MLGWLGYHLRCLGMIFALPTSEQVEYLRDLCFDTAFLWVCECSEG